VTVIFENYATDLHVGSAITSSEISFTAIDSSEISLQQSDKGKNKYLKPNHPKHSDDDKPLSA
jgi:hypothetical protein